MLTQEEFNREFQAISAALEKRRRFFLTLFYLCALAAVLLLCSAVFYPSVPLLAIDRLAGITAPLKRSDIESFRIFIFFFCVYLVLAPIFKYRGSNSSAGLKATLNAKFSLKDEAYSRLFKLFGGFQFAPHGGVSLVDIRNCTLLAEHQVYFPEDYIVGECNEMAVRLCDANVVRVKDHKRTSLFKGLIIVCDISQISVKLRKNFSGRTALISDPQKNIAAIKERYIGMKKFTPPGTFESVLAGYTTDAEEARKIITSALLEGIERFARQAQGLKQQREYWDDKVAYATLALGSYLKEKYISFVGKAELPAEREYDEKYDTGLDLTKGDPLDMSDGGLNKIFELEYYDDKFIFTIPCPYDLFETSSIFQPALNSEDASFLYELMQCLDGVTSYLNRIQ